MAHLWQYSGIIGTCWAVLGPSRGHLGLSWGHIGLFRGRLGGISEASWAILEGSDQIDQNELRLIIIVFGRAKTSNN